MLSVCQEIDLFCPNVNGPQTLPNRIKWDLNRGLFKRAHVTCFNHLVIERLCFAQPASLTEAPSETDSPDVAQYYAHLEK